jgi:stage III sporulation protein AA
MQERIKKEIIKFFPSEIKEYLLNIDLTEIREFRIRVNKPLILKNGIRDIFILKKDGQRYIVNKEEISRIFENICSNSIYAFQDEIANGFLTVAGGHRIGLSGKPLYKDGKIYSMKEISGLNIRVARQIIGCADKIISEILVNNEFTDTLIVSLPGLGKTTILRDLVRQISNSGKDVSLIDERSEIAAIFNGAPQNDVGIRTDVMDGVLKPDGIIMMVRSMKPDFIATDEIGTDRDIEAILYAVNAGVKIIATAHGNSMEDLTRRKALDSVIKEGVFKKIVFLEKGYTFKIVEYVAAK